MNIFNNFNDSPPTIIPLPAGSQLYENLHNLILFRIFTRLYSGTSISYENLHGNLPLTNFPHLVIFPTILIDHLQWLDQINQTNLVIFRSLSNGSIYFSTKQSFPLGILFSTNLVLDHSWIKYR